MVAHSLIKDQDSFRLVFPPSWEVSNYALAPYIYHVFPKVQAPIRILAGKPNLFFTDKLRKQWQSLSSPIPIELMAGYGHLLPLEAPEKCAQAILNTSR